MQSSDPQWYAFQGYNLGKWSGTAIHIDPETGDYAQPYVIRDYTIEVTEHSAKEGDYAGQSGVEKLVSEASKTLPFLESTNTIVPDDDFDATPDGAYSLDRRQVKVPDTSTTASLVVEMSLPMSDDERECSLMCMCVVLPLFSRPSCLHALHTGTSCHPPPPGKTHPFRSAVRHHLRRGLEALSHHPPRGDPPRSSTSLSGPGCRRKVQIQVVLQTGSRRHREAL
jgi:hypothetical protein